MKSEDRTEWLHPEAIVEVAASFYDARVEVVLVYSARGDRRDATAIGVSPSRARELAAQMLRAADQIDCAVMRATAAYSSLSGEWRDLSGPDLQVTKSQAFKRATYQM